MKGEQGQESVNWAVTLFTPFYLWGSLTVLCSICPSKPCSWSMTADLTSSPMQPCAWTNAAVWKALRAAFLPSLWAEVVAVVPLSSVFGQLQPLLSAAWSWLPPLKQVCSQLFLVAFSWHQLSLGVGFGYWAASGRGACSHAALCSSERALMESLLHTDGNSFVKTLEYQGRSLRL